MTGIPLAPGQHDGCCVWCGQPLPLEDRADRQTCSQRCRQARWRFARQVSALAGADDRQRLAYADPPYPGKARLYVGHPDYAGEVDHGALLSRLQSYDGWALSTSAAALPVVLAQAVAQGPEVHVAAWFRGSRPGPSRWPRSSWEPVLYRPARSVVQDDAGEDALVHVSRPRTTDPARVVGAKPAAFASWLFRLLGAHRGDTLDDLFPGSRGIQRAWALAHPRRFP